MVESSAGTWVKLLKFKKIVVRAWSKGCADPGGVWQQSPVRVQRTRPQQRTVAIVLLRAWGTWPAGSTGTEALRRLHKRK